MVGSITFIKEEGDRIRKGDEVCNRLSDGFYFSSSLLFKLLFTFLLRCTSIFNTIWFQFGYFSFGGSTVICVFEKVSNVNIIKHVNNSVKVFCNYISLSEILSTCNNSALQYHIYLVDMTYFHLSAHVKK